MKKPKPKGSGNYTACRECRGTGAFLGSKKSKNSKRPLERQALVRYQCKFCKGSGWVEAER